MRALAARSDARRSSRRRAAPARRRAAPKRCRARTRAHVPTGRELELEHEVAALRERLQRAVVAAPADRPRAMIAFGSAITRPDVYRACAEPGIRRAAEPDSVVYDLPAIGSIFRELQRAARPRGRARRPRGARARAPGRRDREPGAVRDDPRHAGRPRRRRDRLRRRDRRPQHRLVGGVGDARLVHQPLRGARRRRPALVLVELGRRAGVRARRRGRDARRLRARAVAVGRAQRALRRVARRLPRLRPRLLPAGPRGRPQGRHRRLPRDPPPAAARCCPTRRSGSTRTSASPRSGTAGCRASAQAPGTWRERALRAEAERDAARAIARSTALEIEARTAMLEHALVETRTSISWRITAPLRLFAARAPRSDRGSSPDDRLRLRGQDADAYRDHAGPGIERARGARLGGVRDRVGRVDLRRLQPDPRPGRRARRPRGARARRRGHRDRRPRLLRQGPARARRPGRRARRLRRRDRRRERRLVGRRR